MQLFCGVFGTLIRSVRLYILFRIIHESFWYKSSSFFVYMYRHSNFTHERLCELSCCYVGKLEPPQSLSINGSKEEINIAWKKPLYVLQGIAITHYEVNGTLTCCFENGNAKVIAEEITDTVPNRTYTSFQPNLTNCNYSDYNVSVCVNAVTAAGQGELACRNWNGETFIML